MNENLRRRSAGYNLVEVLIATAIMGVVSLSIFTLFFIGRNNVYSGKQMTQAVTIGTRVMEDISAYNMQNLYGTAFNIAGTATGTSITFNGTTYTNAQIRSTKATITHSPTQGNISTENASPGLLARWRTMLNGNKKLTDAAVTLILQPDHDTANDPDQFATSRVLRVRVFVTWREAGRRRSLEMMTLKTF
jgi:prepilin-type N-terminal cleavage/methylation domain-containing protein